MRGAQSSADPTAGTYTLCVCVHMNIRRLFGAICARRLYGAICALSRCAAVYLERVFGLPIMNGRSERGPDLPAHTQTHRYSVCIYVRATHTERTHTHRAAICIQTFRGTSAETTLFSITQIVVFTATHITNTHSHFGLHTLAFRGGVNEWCAQRVSINNAHR